MCEGLVIKCHFLRHQHKLKADPFQLSVRACFSSSGADFTEACWEPAAGIQLRTSIVSIHSLPTPRAPCKPGSERQNLTHLPCCAARTGCRNTEVPERDREGCGKGELQLERVLKGLQE